MSDYVHLSWASVDLLLSPHRAPLQLPWSIFDLSPVAGCSPPPQSLPELRGHLSPCTISPGGVPGFMLKNKPPHPHFGPPFPNLGSLFLVLPWAPLGVRGYKKRCLCEVAKPGSVASVKRRPEDSRFVLPTESRTRGKERIKHKAQASLYFPIIFLFLISIDVLKNTEVFDTE